MTVGKSREVGRKRRHERVREKVRGTAARPRLAVYRSLAQIYAALAYYHSHQAAVEQELADEEAEFDRLKQEHLRTKQP